MSHTDFTGLGRTKDFSVHKLAHELSGKYGVTHGESLTVMWPAWAREVYLDAPERFAQYAENVWGATIGTTEEKARAGIRETEEFWRGLGLPLSFTEIGIGELDEAAIAALADSCTDGGKKTVGAFRPIDRETAITIYRRANH